MTSFLPFPRLHPKLLPLGALRLRLRQLPASRTVVLVNGCFDCHGLTLGHLSTIAYAATIADVVIAATNSDDSIRRLKGPGRPVTTIHERLFTLASLVWTDYVVEQLTDSPLPLIRFLRPRYIVKGGDTKPQDAVETGHGAEILAQYGCELRLAPLAPGPHSSEIAKKELTSDL